VHIIALTWTICQETTDIDVVNGNSPVISTVTGDVVGTEVIGTGEYCKQNISQPVLIFESH
jgi:acyl transferase domain-containing protein